MTKPKPKSEKRKPGPKGHQPTPESRGEVRGMAMANIPKDVIAKAIGIDEKTLCKHYPEEVERGRTKLLAAAATQTARFVYGAKAEFDDRGNMIRGEIKPEQAACFFVLKTQGKKYGWSERTEHTGADGAPLFNDLDLSKLNPAEFQTFKKLLGKCGVAIED